MFSSIVCMIFMIIFSLLGVAFLTLMERKILGYLQLRKGPSKVGVLGLFQPFSDAFKLFTKEYIFLLKVNFYPYWLSPVIALFVSVVNWFVYPWFYVVLSWDNSILFMFMIMSLSVYSVMISGWFSNSVYSILGCMRAIAQSVSYEVSFFLIFISLVLFISSLNLLKFDLIQKNVWMMWILFPVFLMLFVSFLAELNRTPFDFSEGESELVSGFNIEYGGNLFAFIFLAEYLSILFASMLLSLIFIGGVKMIYLKMVILSFFIVLIRGVLPRYRYDKLMYLCWKSFLMVSLNMMLFYQLILYF